MVINGCKYLNIEPSMIWLNDIEWNNRTGEKKLAKKQKLIDKIIFQRFHKEGRKIHQKGSSHRKTIGKN